MRRRIGFLGVIVLLGLGCPARAQQFSSTVGGKPPAVASSVFGTPSLFSQTMAARPSFSAMYVRPPGPAPFSLGSFLPSFSGLRDTILLRNVFSGPQTSFQAPPPIKTQPPPPPK